jgi:hypothetical protein
MKIKNTCRAAVQPLSAWHSTSAASEEELGVKDVSIIFKLHHVPL